MKKTGKLILIIFVFIFILSLSIFADANIIDLQNKLNKIGEEHALSIVSISTEKIVTKSNNFFDPFDFYFEDPWEDKDNNGDKKKREFKQGGLGSGVIFMRKGNVYYIITNNHVIDGVDSIKVNVDQEKSYEGKVLGGDPDVDIAVVEIKTKDDLPVAKIGDSDNIKIGDFVVAVGNPFGLQGSMTFGIISALGRSEINTGRLNLTNFIQTDAAINPGNSGGALFNIEGDVIGINTLIYTRSGGNVGIGFAIPINIIKSVAGQIIENGKVEHGYLGVSFEELNEEKIKILDLKNIDYGMHVLNVFENSSAEKHGIKSGDVLLELNGKKLKKSSDLTFVIGNSKPGTKVRLKILRDGKVIEKEIVLGSRDEMDVSDKKENDSEVFEDYGFVLSDLNASLRESYKIKKNIDGVVIVKVNPRGRAAAVGLQEGDVISKVNNKNIKSLKEIKKIIKELDDTSYFYISRNNKGFIVRM